MRPYECVRVTDMAGVDLARYRFDYGLTFCALLMHADGTILHTYGGQSGPDPLSHLSVASFVRTLGRGLRRHREVDRLRELAGDPPVLGPGWTVESLPPVARRIAAGDRPECVHCHSVDDWTVQTAVEAGNWRREFAWRYPDPIQIGLVLDRDEQTRITEVVRGSPAARVGIRAGDTLHSIDGRRIATFGDVTRALDGVPDSAGSPAALDVIVERDAPGGEPAPTADQDVALESRVLELPPGWRTPDPWTYSWKPMKWNLLPAPGFGGPQLDGAALRELGLPTETFAFRVQYVVTWGPRAFTGRNAARAGIRKGDVILAIDGERDFRSVPHFHSWFRLTMEPGRAVPVELLRGGERRVVTLPVVDE